MREITKMPEPRSLAQHRMTPHCNYDNYPKEDKDKLRELLVAEQQGLCCYCMRSIEPHPDKMKIEHWKCRSKYPGEELNYRNLLASCSGNDRGGKSQQHCDAKKGDGDLQWNPADPSHAIEATLSYGADGRISSNDSNFDAQLNKVLNLNLNAIRSHRKMAIDATLNWWAAEQRKKGKTARNAVKRKIEKFSTADGHLKPYSPVAVWLLRQKISRMR